MGRTKQTNRDKKKRQRPLKVVFKAKKAREEWQETKSDPRWSDLKSYKPADRLWIAL